MVSQMSGIVQFISEQDVTVKACGRACADMHPSTLPEIPAPPPVSLAALMREHPEFVFQREWLAAMEASETIH